MTTQVGGDLGSNFLLPLPGQVVEKKDLPDCHCGEPSCVIVPLGKGFRCWCSPCYIICLTATGQLPNPNFHCADYIPIVPGLW